MTSKLKKKAFARLKPYITQILEKGYMNCDEKVKRIFNNIDLYFNFLRQFFGDLDEVKTVKL
jgi:hypothetical protein